MNLEIVASEWENNIVVYKNEKDYKTNFVEYVCTYKWKRINKKFNGTIRIYQQKCNGYHKILYTMILTINTT